MLHATAIHADLAKRLLRFYPNLINDIYISDEYYGESDEICYDIYENSTFFMKIQKVRLNAYRSNVCYGFIIDV